MVNGLHLYSTIKSEDSKALAQTPTFTTHTHTHTLMVIGCVAATVYTQLAPLDLLQQELKATSMFWMDIMSTRSLLNILLLQSFVLAAVDSLLQDLATVMMLILLIWHLPNFTVVSVNSALKNTNRKSFLSQLQK